MDIQNRWKPGGDKYESMKADEEWEKIHSDKDAVVVYKTDECPSCGGGGFSSYGTGYGDICDDCTGSGEVISGIESEVIK